MECDLAIGPFTFLHVYGTLICRECAFAVLVNELGNKHEVPWREGVSCQRFFPSRCASGWFEVGRKAISQKNVLMHNTRTPPDRQSARRRRHTAATEVALEEHMEAALGRHQQHLDTQHQARVYAKNMGNGSLAVISPWLDRTQWRKIYKNVRRDMLKAMARLPTKDSKSRQWAALSLGQGVADGDADFVSPRTSEERIACVMKAVDLVINRCERTALHTSRLIRCWVVTSRAMRCNSRSFEVMTERSTRYRYRDSWKKFIAFLMRSHHLPRQAREETGVLIPDEISQLLLRLVQHQVWGMFDAENGQWPPVGDDRYASTDEVSGICSNELQEPEIRDEGNSNTAQRLDKTLHHRDGLDEGSCSGESSDSIHYDCQHTISQPNEMASIDFLELLFELSVATCKQEVQGGRPGSTVLLYFSGIFGFSSDCQQFKLARDFCPSLSGLIYVQRLLLLESALPLSAYSSLDTLQRPVDGQLEMIQRLCSKYIVAGSASSLAEIDDDQVVSLGTELTISMDQFRTLSDHFISEAEAMAQELLHGLSPVLSIAKIKDDMTNREVGYSFVKHEENGFQMATRQLLTQLGQPYGHLPPLITHKGWQWLAVKRYLRMVTHLKESIYGGKYTSGGQTPRLRELQWLLCENTAWASRGVYHHKAKRMTNKEFYVFRFLPLRLGLVVIKYLAFIHPVAEVLRRELHEYMQIRELWQPTHLLFGKNENPWTTSRCTSILQAAAYNVWKQKITSQMYRQIAIGITEKHVREVYTPFNQYDDKSPTADKNVIFAMQSGHKVIQRNTTYGLDGAYPHRLQPSLLRAYEWASTRWHEFIHQASKMREEPDVAASHSTTVITSTGVEKHGMLNGGKST
ncbi:hypothetical protein ACQKWADRAFT_325926 [Trichoderma austrokoningii]